MTGDLRDVVSPDELHILRTGVELYLARCEADREDAHRAGATVAAQHWSKRVTQTRALLERLPEQRLPELDRVTVEPQPSAFVRQPRTVIQGRRTQLTCDDDA